jgi:hypothetical protein
VENPHPLAHGENEVRVKTGWMAIATLMCAFAGIAQAADCATHTGCALKVCEVENLMEQARKEGNMRRLATLADIRVEALRCDTKKKGEETVAKK